MDALTPEVSPEPVPTPDPATTAPVEEPGLISRTALMIRTRTGQMVRMIRGRK